MRAGGKSQLCCGRQPQAPSSPALPLASLISLPVKPQVSVPRDFLRAAALVPNTTSPAAARPHSSSAGEAPMAAVPTPTRWGCGVSQEPSHQPGETHSPQKVSRHQRWGTLQLPTPWTLSQTPPETVWGVGGGRGICLNHHAVLRGVKFFADKIAVSSSYCPWGHFFLSPRTAGRSWTGTVTPEPSKPQQPIITVPGAGQGVPVLPTSCPCLGHAAFPAQAEAGLLALGHEMPDPITNTTDPCHPDTRHKQGLRAGRAQHPWGLCQHLPPQRPSSPTLTTPCRDTAQ